DPDRQVVPGADQVHHPVVQVEADPQARVPGQEPGHERRDVLAPERGRGGHAQGAGHLAAALAQPVAQQREFLDQRPALARQGQALGRRVQAAGGPVQQTHPEFALEPLQALAGHRHRQIQVPRRGADGPVFEHLQEQGDVANAVHFQLSIESALPVSPFFDGAQARTVHSRRMADARNPPWNTAPSAVPDCTCPSSASAPVPSAAAARCFRLGATPARPRPAAWSTWPSTPASTSSTPRTSIPTAPPNASSARRSGAAATGWCCRPIPACAWATGPTTPARRATACCARWTTLCGGSVPTTSTCSSSTPSTPAPRWRRPWRRSTASWPPARCATWACRTSRAGS